MPEKVQTNFSFGELLPAIIFCSARTTFRGNEMPLKDPVLIFAKTFLNPLDSCSIGKLAEPEHFLSNESGLWSV
jgi:hypothetical protein